MVKNKFIKSLVSVLLVVLALWVATPKVYIHDLLHHNHSNVLIGNEAKVKSQSTDDCDFEKYDKPVYFNIFKFISNFIPLKPSNSKETRLSDIKISSISFAISFLRGPPASE